MQTKGPAESKQPLAAPEYASAIPRSLYVHIPFCRHRCGYCNFSLVAGRDHLIDDYLAALATELRSRRERLGFTDTTGERPWQLQTLYLGGGTPSHLSLAQLQHCFDLLRNECDWTAACEVTLEANPLDITDELVDLLQANQVNRLSLGAQSFNDAKLKALDRDHCGSDVHRALDRLQPSISNVSIDLIFAAPDETLATWRQDVQQVIDRQVPHISTYGLTIEKGTQFWNQRLHGKLHELDDEHFRSLYQTAIVLFTRAGWDHYEVSSFARPSYRSRHNRVYWNAIPYEAIGSGASRFVEGVRETNHASPTQYLRFVAAGKTPVADRDPLSPSDRARELLVVGLRQLEGLDEDNFHQSTGYRFDEVAGKRLAEAIELGLLERTGQRLKLTPKGLPISDALWHRLLNY